MTIKKIVYCDMAGWNLEDYEELNEDGSLPEGWVADGDQHYCRIHAGRTTDPEVIKDNANRDVDLEIKTVAGNIEKSFAREVELAAKILEDK